VWTSVGPKSILRYSTLLDNILDEVDNTILAVVVSPPVAVTSDDMGLEVVTVVVVVVAVVVAVDGAV